jgi:hypothetical protein
MNVRSAIPERTLAGLNPMTAHGRRLPFAGIAKAIDCVTATKGWSRPEEVIQGSCRERPLSDRKAALAIGSKE